MLNYRECKVYLFTPPNWSWMVWYGKSMNTKRWLAYDDDKGVFEPCEELLQNIIWCEKSMSEMPDAAHPFSNKQK